MTKRIAFISDHASPVGILGGVDSGGQNVYVGQLAKNLAGLGYEVDIFTRRDSERLPEIAEWVNGIRIIHVPAGPPSFVRKEELLQFMPDFTSYVLQFFKCQRKSYDLVHPNFWMSGLVAYELKKQLSLPFVITFHALGRVRRQHQGSRDEFPNQRFEIEDRIVAEADRIIAECPQDEEDLIRLYNADPAKITIVPCGFDSTEVWPISKPLARFALGLPPEEKVILQLGRLVPRKGIDTAIRGFARLVRKHGIEARLLIVGGDSEDPDPSATPEIARLQKIAEGEKVGESVTFVGRRGREALKYYYSAADIFVTCPWYEPFGITPVESMACGTPVVGTNVGGIKFTVRDGETGYLVPPNDADALGDRLAYLYEHPKLMSVLSRQAVRRANDLFTWQKVAANVASLYEEVLAPGRAQRMDDGDLLAVLNRSFESTLEALNESRRRLAPFILDAAGVLSTCFAKGGKLLVCGSGLCSIDACRFANEFSARFKTEARGGLPAVALTHGSPLDALGANELSMENTLIRQLETFGRSGDVFLGISESRRSRSLVSAFKVARDLGMTSISIIGQDSGDLRNVSDVSIAVPTPERPQVREVRTVIMSILCDLVEERLASDKPVYNVAEFTRSVPSNKATKASGRAGLQAASAEPQNGNGGGKTHARTTGKSGTRDRRRTGTR